MATVALSFFAFLAGLVDSVVGGGGLIQIPALLLFLPSSSAAHLPAIFGTNKLSSICGTGFAVFQYSRRIPVRWDTLLPSMLCAFAFSLLGAKSLNLLSKDLLRPLVVVLLLGVTLYTYLKKDLGDVHAPRHSPTWERRWGAVVGMVIGFYDGFFGPGTGSFLMFIFIGWFGYDFLAATAAAKVINLSTNIAAVGYFAATDSILYPYAVPMAVCNMLGSAVGTRLAMLKGNRFVRGFFLVVALAMSLKVGYDLIAARRAH